MDSQIKLSDVSLLSKNFDRLLPDRSEVPSIASI